MKLSGDGFRQIRDALLAAFNPSSLKSMVRIELEEDLQKIVAPGNLTEQVEGLLFWAEENNRVTELLAGARAANPGNAALKEAAAAFLAGDFDADGAQSTSRRSSRETDQSGVTFNQQGQTVGGQQVNIGHMQGNIGHIGDVIEGKNPREEQYEIALHWAAKGNPRMRGFDLSGRNLSELVLDYADLRSANLSASDLSKAYLSGATLHDADLTDAVLARATLHEAKLDRAIMRGADLRGTNLRFVYLQGADLRGAKMDAKTILENVHYDKYTRWPSGFDPTAASMFFVKD